MVLPFWVSILVRTYAWIVILGNDGVVNRSLQALGLVATPVSFLYNEFGVVLGTVNVLLPFLVLPLFAAMLRLDDRLLQAAASLGASRRTIFWRVFFPLTLPSLAAGAILVFILTLGLLHHARDPRRRPRADDRQHARSPDQPPAALGARGRDLDRAAGPDARLLRRLSPGRRARPGLRWPAGSNRPSGPGARLAAGHAAAASRADEGVLARYALALCGGAVLLFLCLPIAVVVPMSFSSASSLEFPPPGFSLRWYHSFFGDPRWLRAAGNSALVALASSAAALVLGSIAAYGLVRGSFRGRALLEGNFVAPLILPPVITAVALYIFFARIGLLGTLPGLIVAHTVLTVPYVVLLMTVAIRAVRRAHRAGRLQPRRVVVADVPQRPAAQPAADPRSRPGSSPSSSASTR